MTQSHFKYCFFLFLLFTFVIFLYSFLFSKMLCFLGENTGWDDFRWVFRNCDDDVIKEKCKVTAVTSASVPRPYLNDGACAASGQLRTFTRQDTYAKQLAGREEIAIPVCHHLRYQKGSRARFKHPLRKIIANKRFSLHSCSFFIRIPLCSIDSSVRA